MRFISFGFGYGKFLNIKKNRLDFKDTKTVNTGLEAAYFTIEF